MIVQAIALLDDLDKEINIYSMRVKVSFSRFEKLPSTKSKLTFLSSLCALAGMVRMAFPRDGQDHRRQLGLR